MARRHWTILVVADDETGARQFRLSQTQVRLTIVTALLAVAALSSVGARYLDATANDSTQYQLVQKNSVLRSELDRLSIRVDTLGLSLDRLADRDQHFRLLAGLEPLDAEVQQAGVGGPGLETLDGSPLAMLDPSMAERVFSASDQVGSLLRRARLLNLSWREAHDSLSERHTRLESLPSISPTRGRISSNFSRSRWHPILDRARPHTGIDITAPIGTPVVASAKGRVSFVGSQGDYGLMVDIDHGYGHVTRYAHLSRAGVKVGQEVARGEIIGAVGRSGLAAGPHLHYEVLVNGVPANPGRYMMDFRVVPE
jgi:murein DD-endopeptidase MepM/ murein hydrolase activator NlpD